VAKKSPILDWLLVGLVALFRPRFGDDESGVICKLLAGCASSSVTVGKNKNDLTSS
jgi:hypothetical protein